MPTHREESLNTKKRIYCAGAMSDPNPIKFLDNLRKGMRISTQLLLEGFAVFSPFIDYSLFFQLREGESIPIEMIQAQSLAWMEVSDAILLVEGWENSRGAQKELERAYSLGIPVFHSLEDLISYFKAVKA